MRPGRAYARHAEQAPPDPQPAHAGGSNTSRRARIPMLAIFAYCPRTARLSPIGTSSKAARNRLKSRCNVERGDLLGLRAPLQG